MASNQQRINTFFQRFDADFNAIVPNIIAETATEYFKERFRVQNWDGVPWQPLSPQYAAKKTKGKGRILTQRGFLFNSIRPSRVGPERITITAGNAQTPYARAHNEGLRIAGVRNVRSYTNNNFMGRGQKVKIRAHSRTVDFKMPKRQYMGHSRFLNQELKDRLAAAWNARR